MLRWGVVALGPHPSMGIALLYSHSFSYDRFANAVYWNTVGWVKHSATRWNPRYPLPAKAILQLTTEYAKAQLLGE